MELFQPVPRSQSGGNAARAGGPADGDQPEIPAKATKKKPNIRTEPEKNLMAISFGVIVSKSMQIKIDRCLAGNGRNRGNFMPEKVRPPLFPAARIAMLPVAARVVKW
jgi:hypothetical protein